MICILFAISRYRLHFTYLNLSKKIINRRDIVPQVEVLEFFCPQHLRKKKSWQKIGPQSEHVGTAWFWTGILGTQCVHVED